MSYDFAKASQELDINNTITIRTNEYSARYKTRLSIADTHDFKLLTINRNSPLQAASEFMGRDVKFVHLINNRVWVYHL